MGPTMRTAQGWTRRAWLRSACCGTIAWQGTSWLSVLASQPDIAARAKRRCILLWMTGGPSQIDTFDMKPGHANGGPFQAIPTTVPGLHISQHLPQVAGMAGDLAIIRSLTSKEGDHERATTFAQSGYRPGGPLKYPTLGATVSKQLQPAEGDLPRYVTIAPGFFSRSLGGGFLGTRYAPLAVSPTDANDGNSLRVENITLPSTITAERFERRLTILNDIEHEYASTDDEVLVSSHRTAYTQAVRMMEGRASAVFDLSREASSVRDAYGRNVFGQGCLLARRLVEQGVPFVEVSLNAASGDSNLGWDTHVNNFDATRRLCEVLDPAMAMLLRDLKSRGLLEDTLVVWMGEFGRTPQINAASGRDHFPNAWTAVLAGGGIRGGQAYGATSGDGMEVSDRPVELPSLLATVCEALGVDWHEQNMSNIGRPIRIVEPTAQPLRELLL